MTAADRLWIPRDGRGFLIDDPGAEHLEELPNPGRVRRPRRCGHQVSVRHSLIDRDIGILGSTEPHLGCDRRVTGYFPPADHAGRRQDLRAVADRGDRFVLH